MGQITKPLKWVGAFAYTRAGVYTLVEQARGAFTLSVRHIELTSGSEAHCKQRAQEDYEALVLDILNNTTVVADLLNRAADAQDASRLALDNMRVAMLHERNNTIDACCDSIRQERRQYGPYLVGDMVDTLQALKVPA